MFIFITHEDRLLYADSDGVQALQAENVIVLQETQNQNGAGQYLPPQRPQQLQQQGQQQKRANDPYAQNK
jgi:hypothetical protein